MQGTPRKVRQPCTAAHPPCSTAPAVPRSSQAAAPIGLDAEAFTEGMAKLDSWQGALIYREQQAFTGHHSGNQSAPFVMLQQASSPAVSYPTLRLWLPLQELWALLFMRWLMA